MQDAAFRTRRVLITPDTMVYQTTRGVFIRPKDCDCPVTGTEDQIDHLTHYDFQVKIRFNSGGAVDDFTLFDFINTAPEPITIDRLGTDFVNGMYWPGSGFKILTPIASPTYISKIVTFRDPAPEGQIAILGVPPLDFTVAALSFYIAPNDYLSLTGIDYIATPSLQGVAGLPYKHGVGRDSDTNEEIREDFPFEIIQGTRSYYFKGGLWSSIVDSGQTAQVFGGEELDSAKRARAAIIPPGTVVTIKGIIQNQLAAPP